jgi:hypothetical protein
MKQEHVMSNRPEDRSAAAASGRGRGAALVAAQQIVAAVIVLSAASCGGGGSDNVQPPAPGIRVGAEAPAVCSGADLSKLTSSVYVSTQGTDSASCGQTTKTACQTIRQGIANCAASGCGVIARHGLYPTSATLALRDGVNVYGGCRFDGEADRRYRTVIRANPAPGLPALAASSINSATTVHGLVVIGKDETASGTASIAMTVSESTGLTLTGTLLWAGQGADGADGSKGVPGIPVPAAPTFCGQTAGVRSDNIWGQLPQTIWTPSSGSDGAQDGAGHGGQQGGASIGLILANASLTGSSDQNAAIVASFGGRGGNGGPGGVRQAGGAPFVAGSGGAGGNGGPSIAVALTGGSAIPTSSVVGIYPPNVRSAFGGAGGAGGVVTGCQAAAGAGGFGGAVAFDVVSMERLPNNLLTPGQSVDEDHSLDSADRKTRLDFQETEGSILTLCLGTTAVFDGGGCDVNFQRVEQEDRTRVVMQTDGNLCMPGVACTNTAGHPGALLLVSNDGSAVLLDGPIVLWSLP